MAFLRDSYHYFVFFMGLFKGCVKGFLSVLRPFSVDYKYSLKAGIVNSYQDSLQGGSLKALNTTYVKPYTRNISKDAFSRPH